MKEREEKWIKLGYETFAIHGEASLKVEQLAKEVGVSKSSFYHHFVDLTFFKERLFEYHLSASKIIAEKEKKATSINPDLINILLEHKIDLLFNRQLRINACESDYRKILLQSNHIIGKDFVSLWLKDMKLMISRIQAEGLFELALENFFLQINPESLNRSWLEAYFENLKRITQHFDGKNVR